MAGEYNFNIGMQEIIQKAQIKQILYWDIIVYCVDLFLKISSFQLLKMSSFLTLQRHILWQSNNATEQFFLFFF